MIHSKFLLTILFFIDFVYAEEKINAIDEDVKSFVSDYFRMIVWIFAVFLIAMYCKLKK